MKDDHESPVELGGAAAVKPIGQRDERIKSDKADFGYRK
jgi:hypothetical protein